MMMKINSNRENLIKGIQTIQAGVSAKTGTLPILQNFLMETEGQGLKVVFTDLEMAIKHHINVEVKGDGSITVPIKKFLEIIQNLGPDADVNVNVDDGNKVSILSGKTRFKISGAPKADYPVIPDLDESNSFTAPAALIADMVSRTVFSASTEDERHFLNGLLWKYEKGIFSVVATDGRRLAVATSQAVKAKKDFKVIVPSKILGELVKFIKSADLGEKEELTVGLSSNQIGFRIAKTVFVSRLIEGNFPAYEQIIPKTRETSVEIDTARLLALTKRASLCSNERSGAVKYTFKKGVLVVNSSSQTMDFEDETDVDYKGKDLQVSFNPKFVMDVLRNIGEAKALMEFNAPSTPALIKPVKGEDFLYIVMPLRAQ
ncbi:MAG TPA: DNA polymerase III subunit beta [Elusimicrobia bacterium]|nr:DNA polymerase III subunit beta [Elusimicrobiota bacterium]